MRGREGPEAAAARWAKLALVQDHYEDFLDFLRDGMELLGFSTTEIQEDIANWIVHGPQYLMVQAQRGQAKTTIVALYAVWVLIHNPAERVLIVSAGSTQADEISTLIVRVVMAMDILECMRPDKMAGDKTATDGFDIHHSLKGLDKSPSVGCFGIDSNIQGKRAGLLIPDDVESGKNSQTAIQRAKILHITKDFTSINSTGRILWMGTPQSVDSIYNTLPGRGVAVRIWPGRYPTSKQREGYGDNLAPIISSRLAADPELSTGGGLLGDQGRPIDPVLLNEQTLQKKERDQGEAYFQLQHMLSTALSDALRYPLKPTNLIVVQPPGRDFPLTITRGMEAALLRDFKVGDFGFKMMQPHAVSRDLARLQSIRVYIDPAAGGANADETAFAVAGFLNGNIYLLGVGGVPGGYELEKLQLLADLIAPYRPNICTIEKNMGHGAFRHVFQPILAETLKRLPDPHLCQIDDDLVAGTQKEVRIINVLSPIMGRGSLIVLEDVVEQDERMAALYPAALRGTYSLFFQMAKLTAQRDALIHDDRLDALAGVCASFTEDLAKDQKKEIQRLAKIAHAALMHDPLGYKRYTKGPATKPNLLNKYRRGR